MFNQANQNKVTFTAQGPDRKLKDGIKAAFLERKVIDLHNPPPTLRSAGGTVYVAHYDNIVLEGNSRHFLCLCSFQQHFIANTDSTENHCVVRLFKQPIKIESE